MSSTYIKKKIDRAIAAWWQCTYRTQYRITKWKSHYARYASTVLVFLLIAVSLYLSPILQEVLRDYYSSQQQIESLRALMLGVGSALIGATAIATSLVLFAMQVNIERMPHGLFRRLSADSRLLSAFALAFLLAIGVAILSTFVQHARLAIVLFAASWAIVFILSSFLYAYRRALRLINPLEQLDILIQTTRKELQDWSRRARRAAPLLVQEENAGAISSPFDSTHDLTRTAYFKINEHWTDGAERAIRHAMSFARRYAEQGDYEVSGAALKAIVVLNTAYVESKGKTFFCDVPFVDNPLASDSFINDTLEHLRLNVQAANSRQDEQQIEQTLRTMAALVQVYLTIDYSNRYATKSHAFLAAGYLANAVQTVVPHDMADVLMEGQRLMGQCAQGFLAHGDPASITTLSEKIALISCTGCAKENYRPVTMVGMTQLSNLTFDLLRARSGDINFAVDKVRRDVAMIVKLFLNVNETPLSNIHSTFLGPYYSSTSAQGLRARLTHLVNSLAEVQSDNAGAQTVIHNLEQWAEDLYRTEKELLLAAIKARSHFTFEMIHWICGITEILLAVSSVPACDDPSREKIREYARWLISTLTWIPDDEETVRFIENFQMTETLFRAAMDARARDCDEIASQIGKILLSWTFKGGRFQTGWGILKRGLCACAVFALKGGEEQVEALKASIGAHILNDVAPAQEVRESTARNIREMADRLPTNGHWASLIDTEVSQADYEDLRPLLQEIANILSPDAA